MKVTKGNLSITCTRIESHKDNVLYHLWSNSFGSTQYSINNGTFFTTAQNPYHISEETYACLRELAIELENAHQSAQSRTKKGEDGGELTKISLGLYSGEVGTFMKGDVNGTVVKLTYYPPQSEWESTEYRTETGELLRIVFNKKTSSLVMFLIGGYGSVKKVEFESCNDYKDSVEYHTHLYHSNF